MKIFTHTLLSAAAFAALATAPALADDKDQEPIIIDQLQLDDVWSNVNVHVERSKQDIVASASAVSNASTVHIDSGSVDARVKQVSDGGAESNVHIWAGDVSHGQVISSSVATGNSSYVGNWYGDASVHVQQDQIQNVTAQNSVDVEKAWAISTQTTAAANVSEVESDFGDFVEANQKQFADSSVFAASKVDAGYVDGFVQNAAIAAGNSSAAFVGDTPDAWVTGSQVTKGENTITSSAETYVDAAGDVITASAAAGNQLNVSAEDSYTFVGTPGQDYFQGNEADIFAGAHTTVSYVEGVASSSATGVGNSAHISAWGGSTSAATVQNNYGDVGSDVSLNTGDFSGGIGLANASSIGNSFAAVAQDGDLSGRAIQTNSGRITATANVRTGTIGSVAATATAIGNSATFEQRANNNGRRD